LGSPGVDEVGWLRSVLPNDTFHASLHRWDETFKDES
jgi:hypothetical protein